MNLIIQVDNRELYILLSSLDLMKEYGAKQNAAIADKIKKKILEQ